MDAFTAGTKISTTLQWAKIQKTSTVGKKVHSGRKKRPEWAFFCPVNVFLKKSPVDVFSKKTVDCKKNAHCGPLFVHSGLVLHFCPTVCTFSTCQ